MEGGIQGAGCFGEKFVDGSHDRVRQYGLMVDAAKDLISVVAISITVSFS
jgi:hypothetical protein